MALEAEAAQKAAVRLGYPSLREQQLEAIVSFISGNLECFCRAADRMRQALLVYRWRLMLYLTEYLLLSFVATPLIALRKDQVSVSP